MELNYSKIFNKETLGSVESFCKLNNIDDVDSFIKNIFQEGFNIKKYGLLGKTLNEGEKDLKTGGIEEKRVEIEVIREIRVEVPVEVIKEVEKIVTKIEYISDKNSETELLLKIQQLEEEMSKKDEKLDELRRNLDIILDISLDEPPVEVIKEVEKPNDRVEMLQETLISLRKELQTKNERIKELEKINRDLENLSSNKGAVFLRGSNLNSRI
jgi:hypothetical protein